MATAVYIPTDNVWAFLLARGHRGIIHMHRLNYKALGTSRIWRELYVFLFRFNSLEIGSHHVV